MKETNVERIVDRVLSPERRNEVARFPYTALPDFALVCRGRERELATPGELAELRAAEARYQEFNGQRASVSVSAAAEIVKQNRKNYLNEPTSEKFDAMREAELSQSDLDEKFSAMRRTIGAARAEHTVQTNPLAIPVLARALVMVEAEMPKLRASEEKAAESFGVAYAPSPTVLALQALGGDIEKRIFTISQNFGMGHVAQHLAGILTL